MRRRDFLALSSAVLARMSLAEDLPDNLKIVRVSSFDVLAKRPKLVGKNSRLDVHGDHSVDRVVRLIANDGTEGFGCCRASDKALSGLLGKNPPALLTDRTLGVHSMPLWDLMGKIAKKPAYELLAASEKPQADGGVRVYDGSIYFADLLPEFEHTWRDRFRWEVDEIFSRGHRAFKVKIGRGAKWMPREEGDRRDVDVLKLLREHAGKDAMIAVDANNGYGLERTKWLLNELPDYNFAFVEEMFPEKLEDDLELKRFLREKKLSTLVADGETQSKVESLKPFMPAKAIDLYQLDVNAVGCEGLMEEAAACAPYGQSIAPHTWGTLLGFYAQLHVARAIGNFYSGEQDPLASPMLIADGYTIKEGRITVPPAPGFGLKLDPKHLAQIKPLLDLRA